ncbi:MAG: glutamine synthetase III [Eubacteriales bacterium]|nr:glutamine synthetase III [Eubacteriales bacterium]MDY5860849.1 glutamine synthetase III [Eubacteriales bacterium]
MTTIPEYFGDMVFDDAAMKTRLPKEAYEAMKRTIEDGRSLNLSVANAVASAMKDWAVSKGATHYTHWFQPMTGITAEKHDSFISPTANGKVIMEFSGKELIKGEPDASSFPSGGLRATFEARGYTAWDPTSYAFIKGKTLCIPTAFCSYGGEALDKKTPLLRSMEALNRQAMRVLRLFGNADVTSVKTTVGPEQEYFLIDKEMFDRRRDLIFTGRTLFGAKPPKGQELDDHYFGAIKPRVRAFMEELDEELWHLGVLAKTEHNEVAPAQHELAPIFTTTNIATDHNQLTMELMQSIAKKHGLVCLLHEKPFAGVNGSGKHNNWSMQTNTGANLLAPGETPHENAQFLLFLCAVIQAVDDYQDLLRLSVASAGNDHRLGANEAPPAIVSVFLGDELSAVLDSIENDTCYSSAERVPLKLGVHVLPKLPRDTTDRNRTSPFAFTGNKFEFRMLGSSSSIACTNIMLNTAVAESLRLYADELEGAADFSAALHSLIRRVIREHKRIIFNGNGYDDSWIKEAERRGLLNLRTTPDCLPYLIAPKNLELFARHRIYTAEEARSRYEILMDNYCKVMNIESMTMIDMVRREILPAVCEYSAAVADGALKKKSLSTKSATSYEEKLVAKLSSLADTIDTRCDALENALCEVRKAEDVHTLACGYRDRIFIAMQELRAAVDEAENMTAAKYWPYPTYADLLFGVR